MIIIIIQFWINKVLIHYECTFHSFHIYFFSLYLCLHSFNSCMLYMLYFIIIFKVWNKKFICLERILWDIRSFIWLLYLHKHDLNCSACKYWNISHICVTLEILVCKWMSTKKFAFCSKLFQLIQMGFANCASLAVNVLYNFCEYFMD